MQFTYTVYVRDRVRYIQAASPRGWQDRQRGAHHTNKQKKSRAGDVAHSVNCLSGINEALGSIANTTYIEHGGTRLASQPWGR